MENNQGFEETEEFKEGMQDTVADLRLAAIKAGYSLEDIGSHQIEKWIRQTVITENPVEKLRLIRWNIEEFGKPLPKNEVQR